MALCVAAEITALWTNSSSTCR